LLKKIGKSPEQELEKFITRLNTASIANRYPDDLAKIQSACSAEVTEAMITESKDVLKWIKTQL
jgi:HEPN domain-containing protein